MNLIGEPGGIWAGKLEVPDSTGITFERGVGLSDGAAVPTTARGRRGHASPPPLYGVMSAARGGPLDDDRPQHDQRHTGEAG